MSFELEWAIALTVVVLLVGLLVFLPKKKKLPRPSAPKDDDEPPRPVLFHAVLRSLLANPAIFAVCHGENPDEVLFVRVSWHHPEMNFGHVQRRSFLSRVMDNARKFAWMIVSAVAGAAALGVACALGLRELGPALALSLLILAVVVPLVVGVVMLVAPISWLGARAAEREFARESEKLAALPLADLLDVAYDKPNLRADLADLTGAEVDRHWDDPDDKIATLRFRHDPTGAWTFDLYSEEDTQAAERLMGLPTPRRRMGRPRPKPKPSS